VAGHGAGVGARRKVGVQEVCSLEGWSAPAMEAGRKRRWEAGQAAGSTGCSLAGLSPTEDFVRSTGN